MAQQQQGASARAVAADLKVAYPTIYLQVTGRTAWADKVGREYRRAEATWLRYVRRLLVQERAS